VLGIVNRIAANSGQFGTVPSSPSGEGWKLPQGGLIEA
jgi:hypothetical protein